MGIKIKKGTPYRMPKRFLEDLNWAYSQYSNWIKKYPEEWVTIVNKKIVSHSKIPDVAERIARKKTGMKFIPSLFVEGRIHVY